MNIVIPLAGRDPDPHAPYKPFTTVHGQPLITHVVNQHTITRADRLIFILLKEHELQYGVSDRLYKLFGSNICIRLIHEETKGAPCSILQAATDLIHSPEPLLIELADVLRDLSAFYKQVKQDMKKTAGIIPVEKNRLIHGRPWGYVTVNEEGRVAHLYEKQQPTTPGYATMGLYFFSHGSDFVSAAQTMIEQNSFVYEDRYFVGPVYNELIKTGNEISISHVRINTII